MSLPPRPPTTRSRRVAWTAALLAVAAGCGGAADDARPHVLLVSLDSVRHDLLGAYGHAAPGAPDLPSSPALDRLAAEGVLVRRAYATTSWTLPSHVSILTGQPEIVHTVDRDTQRPDPVIPFLSEILREHGYRTAGFFSGPYLEPHFGFARGFDTYRACYGAGLRSASARAAEARERLAEARRSGDPKELRTAAARLQRAERDVQLESHRDVSSEVVTDAVLEELESAARDGRPFFVFAHYFDPHYDYAAPAPYDRRFDPEFAEGATWSNFTRNPAVSLPDPRDPTRRERVLSDRQLDNVRARYAGELAWTDAQIGRILERLEALGLRERTLVIVTADHGDEFFEHGSIGHRSTLFEELTRVPLLLSLPGTLPAGRELPGPVSTADVVPTVLELLGIRSPSALASESLLPLLDGRGDGSRRAAFGRIVCRYPMVLDLPDDVEGGSGIVQVPGQMVRLLETFHLGAIKVTRERAWIAAPGAAPEQIAELERTQAPARATDLLRWIDVERHPGERPEDHSTDFSDPRAREALREFHDRYQRLLRLRGTPHAADGNEPFEAQLRALGYLGDEGEEQAATDEEERCVFPPPGRDLLGS